MTALSIRLATRADVPSLNALIERSARALSVGFYTPAQIEAATRYVFGVDTRLIDDGTYFVVHGEAAVAGCGGWSRQRTLYGGDQRPVGGADLLDPATEPARIRAFFVAPEWARRGVARLLLTHSLEAARRAGFSRLELAATLPGVPFYAALGFTEVERIVDRVPDGTPLGFVRMARAID